MGPGCACKLTREQLLALPTLLMHFANPPQVSTRQLVCNGGGLTIGDSRHDPPPPPERAAASSNASLAEHAQAYAHRARDWSERMTPAEWDAIALAGATYHPGLTTAFDSPIMVRHPTACAIVEFRKAVWVGRSVTVDPSDHYRRQLPITGADRVLTTPADKLRLSSLIAARAAGILTAVRLVQHLTKQQLISTDPSRRKELEAGFVNDARSSFDSIVLAMVETPPTETDLLVQLQSAVSREAEGEVGRIMSTLFSNDLEVRRARWVAMMKSSSSVAKLSQPHGPSGSGAASKQARRAANQAKTGAPRSSGAARDDAAGDPPAAPASPRRKK